MQVILAILIGFLGQAVTVSAVPTDLQRILKAEREEVANKWAPLVWLHSEEQFYPSSVLHFLKYARTSKYSPGPYLIVTDGESEIILPSLPRGHQSQDTYLMANFKKECRNCRLPKYLHGRKPGSDYTPPTYGVINSCSSTSHNRQYSQRHYRQYLVDQYDNQRFLNDEGINSNYEPSFSEKTKSSSTVTPAATQTTSVQTSITSTKAIPSVSTQYPVKEINNTHESKFQDTSKSSTVRYGDTVTTKATMDSVTSDKDINIDDSQYSTPKMSFNRTINLANISEEHTTQRKVNENSEKNMQNKTEDTMTKPPNNVTSHSSLHTTDSTMTVITYEDKNLTAATQQPPDDFQTIENSTEDFLNSTQNPVFSQEMGGDTHTVEKRNVPHGTGQEFSVTYWMFYPFNYGKDMCTASLGFLGRMLQPTIGGSCSGERIPMGNHVGDWEHITIKFKGQMPTDLYISSHYFGAFYKYDPKNHVFQYSWQDTREGIPLSPKYAPFIRMQENHPIVFSALGSHGLWPTPANHEYSSFPSLVDKTNEGTEWQTWKNLELIDYNFQNEFNPFQRHWLSYEGRWGNPKFNCHPMMAGFCELNHGPTGIPRKRINFPCQR